MGQNVGGFRFYGGSSHSFLFSCSILLTFLSQTLRYELTGKLGTFRKEKLISVGIGHVRMSKFYQPLAVTGANLEAFTMSPCIISNQLIIYEQKTREITALILSNNYNGLKRSFKHCVFHLIRFKELCFEVSFKNGSATPRFYNSPQVIRDELQLHMAQCDELFFITIPVYQFLFQSTTYIQ